MAKLRVHIGHHFFGSGNLGDDLMLAGFLTAARPAFLKTATLTCCTAQDAASQRRRFPEVEWLPYDHRTRAACIRQCDVWLGLGDTPFQAVDGNTWFLDHLSEEAAWCRQFGVSMFYLGIGVNERATADLPQTRALVGQAARLWMRDDDSAAILLPLTTPGQATAHADLAHLVLADMRFPPPEPRTLGLVLNFEDPAQFRPAQLTALIRAADDWQVHWLAQEIRPLPGSETSLHAQLPPAERGVAPLLVSDYAGAATPRALLTAWEGLGALFTSRYHAALIGAWMGARVAVFARSDKVAWVARQLGVPGVDAMNDHAAILRAVAAAPPVPRGRLLDLAVRSREACEEFFAWAHARRSRMNHHRIPPADLLKDPQPTLAALFGFLDEPFDADRLKSARIERSRPEITVPGSGVPPEPPSPIAPRASLGSATELASEPFRLFMEHMNRFATRFELRTFIDWSKVWEYPWLWFHGLSQRDWSSQRLVDLGSEISPMPWFLAVLGARVTLIETDPQWIPRWEALRRQLNVDVDWHIVDSERLPLADAEVDVLTSFSVIEHQPDKRRAVDEVARVLRSGGLLAISFDICEPDQGMTFPEWNGRALTLREFQEFVWRHPAFDAGPAPAWNSGDIPEFRRWHLQSAPHHNYIVGAAVLTRHAGADTPAAR